MPFESHKLALPAAAASPRSFLRHRRVRRATLVALAMALLGGWGASAAHASAYGGQDIRWPGGVVYYDYDVDLPQAVRDRVVQAVNHVNYYKDITGVQIVPRSGQQAWVRIYPTAGPSHVSQIGYPFGSGSRSVSMWLNTTDPSWQTAVHEFGHVIGLAHEHQRCERDAWVKAPDSEEMARQCSLPAVEAYNPLSIMHYSVSELDVAGATFIGAGVVPPPKPEHPGLVDSDLRTIATMYRSDGVFSIVSAMHGKCLEAPGVTDGTGVVVSECDTGNDNHRFVYSAASGALEVNGMCLDATKPRRLQTLVVRICNGRPQQQWDLGNFGELVLRMQQDGNGTALCAEIANADRSDRAKTMLQYCQRGENQLWRRGHGEFGGSTVSLVSDLTPPEVTSGPRLSKCANAWDGDHDGTALLLWDCKGPADPYERFTRTADRELRVFGRCVDGENGQAGSLVRLRDCDLGADQQWELTPSGTLRAVNGLCIAVANASAANATSLVLATCATTRSQLWSLREAR